MKKILITEKLDFLLCSIKMMMQAGLIDKWKDMSWQSDDECSASSAGQQSVNTFVTVSDMQGSFFILFIGKKA